MVRFVPLSVWLPAFCLPAVWLPALYLLWPRIKSLREKIIKNIHFRKFWIITKRWILNLNSIIFGPIFVINWGLSLFLIRYKIMTKIPLAFMYKFRNILHNWTVLKNKRLWTISHKQIGPPFLNWKYSAILFNMICSLIIAYAFYDKRYIISKW